jgi:hypothetical protein
MMTDKFLRRFGPAAYRWYPQIKKITLTLYRLVFTLRVVSALVFFFGWARPEGARVTPMWAMTGCPTARESTLGLGIRAAAFPRLNGSKGQRSLINFHRMPVYAAVQRNWPPFTCLRYERRRQQSGLTIVPRGARNGPTIAPAAVQPAS